MSVEIRPFGELFREAAAFHQEGARLLQTKSPDYKRFFSEAETRYKDLLRTEPNNEQTLFLRGTLYLQTGDSGIAIALLEKCTRINPEFFDAWNNLGAAWRQEHRNDEAVACYRRALEIQPEEADILANLCAIAVNEGDPQSGIPYGEKCLEINPLHPQGRWNLGLLYLEDGQWDRGFKLYNKGFETGDRIHRTYGSAKQWDGTGLGGTIVVHGEQGRGDELLWMQFVHEIRDMFDKVIIDCHPGWYNAMVRSFPWATVYPTRKSASPWVEFEKPDWYCSIASLPEWFWPSMGKHSGWLKPDPVKVKQVRRMITAAQGALGEVGRPIVGISWFGGTHKTRHDLRSVPLNDWEPVFDLPASLLSLQYNPASIHEATTVDRLMHWQCLTGNQDLDWSLALVACSDLLLTVNTTAFHIAGAMGREVWTMTPYGHAWRYGKATDRVTVNPFYGEHALQFNQRKGEPWAEVMAEVADDLKVWLGERA